MSFSFRILYDIIHICHYKNKCAQHQYTSDHSYLWTDCEINFNMKQKVPNIWLCLSVLLKVFIKLKTFCFEYEIGYVTTRLVKTYIYPPLFVLFKGIWSWEKSMIIILFLVYWIKKGSLLIFIMNIYWLIYPRTVV